jgi:hypothetical protein
MQQTEPINDCKRRKRVSDAEKVASEISKIVCELYKLAPRNSFGSHIKFENRRIVFPQTNPTSEAYFGEVCNLTDHRQKPCYCSRAEFKLEAFLPDRDHLTRYSVRIVGSNPFGFDFNNKARMATNRIAWATPRRVRADQHAMTHRLIIHGLCRSAARVASRSRSLCSTSSAPTATRSSPAPSPSRAARSPTTSSPSGVHEPPLPPLRAGKSLVRGRRRCPPWARRAGFACRASPFAMAAARRRRGSSSRPCVARSPVAASPGPLLLVRKAVTRAARLDADTFGLLPELFLQVVSRPAALRLVPSRPFSARPCPHLRNR